MAGQTLAGDLVGEPTQVNNNICVYIYMLSDHDFRLKTRQNPFNFVLTGVEFFPFTFRVAIYKWSL